MSKHVTRRTFLKLAGAGAVGTLLAACGPAPATEAPKPAEATPVPEATKAPEPTATTAAAAPAEKKKLVFSSYTWSGYEASMNQVISMWLQENPGVEVETMYAGWDDYWPKLQTQVAAGEPPDLGIADYGRVVSYAKGGVLLELDDLIARDKYSLDQLIPAGVAQYRWAKGDFDTGGEGGHMYGLPSDAQATIFVYNKKMFDEAGAKYPTDDWTWDDLVAAGKTITKPNEDKWGISFPGLPISRGVFLYQTGGSVVTSDYTKCALDTPEALEAYKWPWDLIYTDKIAPAPGGEPVNPFLSGGVAMSLEGIWMIADYATIKDFEWDMAMLPKNPKTGKGTTSLESDGWWVFKKAKDPEVAWNLMKYMVSPQGQAKFAELNFVVPPSIPEAAEKWYDQKPPEHRKKALDNLLEDSKKHMFTFYENATIMGAVGPVLERAWSGGEDIEAILKEATQAFNEELDKAWKLYNES